jgi:glutathione S-transferase
MKTNPGAYTFNCAQRAYANFLENAPQTMVSMLVAGLAYPTLTAALGLGWLFSRVLNLVGYVYSGKDKGCFRVSYQAHRRLIRLQKHLIGV